MKTKNTIIKVLALLAVIGAIVYVIRKQRDEFNKFEKDTKIAEFDFHKYIKQRIEEELPENANWQTAMDTYKTLYGVIQTENAIMLENGQPVLKPTIADSCYSEAFASYWHLFQRYVDHDYFGIKQDNWNKNDLFQIKNMADSLGRMNGRSGQQSDSLREYANYVEKYYDVSKDKKGNPMYENKNKELASLVDNCSSKQSFDNVINIRNEFNKYPYINNNAFAATINRAESDAKKKWETAVENRVKKLVEKPDEYWAEQKTVNDTLVITWTSNSVERFDNEGCIKLEKQANELTNSTLKTNLKKRLSEHREHISGLNGTTIKKPINNEN